VQVLLDGRVAETFLDRLQIRATGQEPRGVRVAQAVRAYRCHASFRERWPPDLVAEPVPRDVAVGITGSRIVLPGRSPTRPVLGEGVLAVDAPAASSRLGAQRRPRNVQ
jgi:hypothetical protein